MSLNIETLEKKLKDNKVVLIDFWADKVNVDEERDLAAKYGVRSLPTVIFFKDGEVMERIPGVASKSTYIDKLKYYLN